MFPQPLKYIVSAAVALSSCAHATVPDANAPQAERRMFTPRAVQGPSPDIVTSNWAEVTLPSARASHKIYGAATAVGALFGSGASVEVEMGNQKFQLLIDTGSSDLWIPTEDFKCFGTNYAPKHPTQADCAFGPLYKKAPGFERILDRNFNLTYAGLGEITGIPGLDTVTIAGIAVPNAHVNLVNEAFWTGDNVTSGVIGLAYPALTSVYPGFSPKADVKGQQIPYATFFKSMYTNTSVAPVFSLALDRKPNTYGLVKGGKIAFGGLPPVKHTGDFARSQIIIHKVIDRYPAGRTHFSEYTIIPDGFVFPGAGNLTPFASDVNNQSAQENKRSMINTDFPMFVDSGTTLLYIPRELADAVNAAYSPPARYDPKLFAYVANCTAIPPKFGVVIGGKTFYLNPEDMFAGKIGHGLCYTGIDYSMEPNSKSKVPPFSILGVAFLKSVLAVFDVGASEMRFAAREKY